MTREDAIDVLRRHEDALRARGVRHAALFGSVARGQAGSDSDVDIMIELDPAHHVDLWAYAGLKQFIEEMFPSPVDVVDRDGLKPHVRGRAVDEAVYAF